MDNKNQASFLKLMDKSDILSLKFMKTVPKILDFCFQALMSFINDTKQKYTWP